MQRHWFAMLDPDQTKPFPICYREAEALNEKCFGIFWTVNQFRQGVRRKDHLVKINSWAIEMDKEPKIMQWRRILNGPLPSLIVETKRGFHVYFNAKDGTQRNWEAIVSDRLLPFYQADPNAKDIARILRVPGFYHCKNPHERWLVTQVYSSQAIYSENDMFSLFPITEPKHVRSLPKARIIRQSYRGDDFWERAKQLDCEIALEKLSGLACVNYEVFTFKSVPGGKLNIFVNNKSTSCWIDANKKIGSHSKGGPGIAQWLRYYGHSYAEIYRILRDVFPELEAEGKTG